MKNLIIFLLFIPFLTSCGENNHNTYADDLISFEYPESFAILSEKDLDDFTTIHIDGPEKTSLVITITPELYQYDLHEYSDVMHQLLENKSKMGNHVVRKTKEISTTINGEEHPGITNYYSARSFLDKSKFQFSFYILYGPENTFIVQEERRDKYIKGHKDVVESIINSIELQGLNAGQLHTQSL
uniref:Lipoprotein n=1 Tax=uncultured Thiotrichaceae bacterium TaxID=298394 RepID=A0A6S6SPL7_9GAMM|nr:MAG: Unknown protein [uncultured Thiotrichaceae bacterium]